MYRGGGRLGKTLLKKIAAAGVLLFAAALVFTSCSDGSDSGGKTPPASYVVTFGVDGGNGTLKAQPEGGGEVSTTTTDTIRVEHGKTVTFTAAPVGNYRIKEWRVNNVVVTGCTDNPYTRIVTKALDVKVSFEPLPPGTASYTVKHYQEQTDDSYPAEPTESEILHGTVGENAAYTPKSYEGFTYNSALTKINGTIADDGSTVVELYYERNTVNATFKLAGGNISGSTDDVVLSGKYGTALTAPAPVQAGVAFKGWDPELPSPLVFPAADTEYTAQWVALYNIDFGVEGGTGGTLTAQAEGEEATTNSPISVEYGKTVTFTAAPADGYEVECWTNGGTVIDGAGTDTNYSYTVTADADIKVKFLSLFVEGGASLILSPDKLDIRITVITSDGSVTVEGCTEETLASGTETVLHARGTRVILKGKITELHCNDNQLSALNVQGCIALKWLYCYNNQLGALNVQGCAALQKLYCYSNRLDALNVQGLSALQTLYCGNNQLDALDVQGCAALQELYCGGNQLAALDVQGCAALQTLHCGVNRLDALNVQGCIALKWLFCNNNQLGALDVQGCTALKWLQCYSNRLDASAFEKIFDDLPQRAVGDGAMCYLYTEKTGENEGNYTDFTAPETLKNAFKNAKTVKKWKMYKINAGGSSVEI